jgi:hypothetical protein
MAESDKGRVLGFRRHGYGDNGFCHCVMSFYMYYAGEDSYCMVCCRMLLPPKVVDGSNLQIIYSSILSSTYCIHLSHNVSTSWQDLS